MSWWFRAKQIRHTSGTRASIERLEQRQLLASAAAEPAEALFAAKVDFQPAWVDIAVPGYVADVGQDYGPQANGLTYGWSTPNQSWARIREFSNTKWATLNHLGDDNRWAIQVPNGTYRVYIAGGDAAYTNSDYKIDIEGERAIDKKPTKRKPFVDAVIVVRVEDGALSVTSGEGGVNNKVGFIEIQQMADPEPIQITWTDNDAAPSPVGRVDAAATQVGSRLYILGGYINGEYEVTDRFDIFDLETQTWSQGRQPPGASARTHGGFTSDGHRFIYLVAGQPNGGFTYATRNAYRYDIKHDKWDEYAKLPEARYGGALVYNEGKLHYFGGNTADRVTTSTTHWVSNTLDARPDWVEAAPLPRGGDHLAGAVVNGTIYAIGGEHGHAGLNNEPPPTYSQHSDVYAYTPSTDTWTRRADLPVGSSHFEAATLVLGNKILTIGGFLDGGEPTGAVRIYDTITDVWSTLSPLPDARENAAAAYLNGRVFVTAGFSSTLDVTARSYWGTLAGV